METTESQALPNGSRKKLLLGINGSSRKNGNTALLIDTVGEQVTLTGHRYTSLFLADYRIEPCQGCFACRGTLHCIIDDDFDPVFRQMLTADAIVLGTPVYSADVSARMKLLLDRAAVLASVNPGIFRHKIGAGIAAVRRAGGLTAVDTLNHFFLNKEFIVVGSTYWNMVYGKNPGDALLDAEGMANMKNLGDNIGWLLSKW